MSIWLLVVDVKIKTILEEIRQQQKIEKIKIGVLDWNIIEVKDLLRDESIFGDCKFNNLTIRIDIELEPTHKRQILIHELLHACLFTMYEEDLNGNEKFVNTLSNLLTQINQQIYEK